MNSDICCSTISCEGPPKETWEPHGRNTIEPPPSKVSALRFLSSSNFGNVWHFEEAEGAIGMEESTCDGEFHPIYSEFGKATWS